MGKRLRDLGDHPKKNDPKQPGPARMGCVLLPSHAPTFATARRRFSILRRYVSLSATVVGSLHGRDIPALSARATYAWRAPLLKALAGGDPMPFDQMKRREFVALLARRHRRAIEPSRGRSDGAGSHRGIRAGTASSGLVRRPQCADRYALGRRRLGCPASRTARSRAGPRNQFYERICRVGPG